MFFLLSTNAAFSLWGDGRINYDLPAIHNSVLETQAAQVLILCMISWFFLMNYINLKKYLDWFCVINGAYVIYNTGLFGSKIGLANNIGIDSLVLATWIPAMAFRRDSPIRPYVIIPIIAVAMGKTVTMNMAMIAGIVSYLFVIFNTRGKIIIASISLLSFILITLNLDMFFDGKRYLNWSYFLEYSKDNLDYLRGMGAGSFWVMGPKIQSLYYLGKFKGFVFAHNEFIQVFMEYGTIVFGLFIFIIKDVLQRAYKKPWLFSCCVVYVFTFTTWTPFRFILTIYLGLILLGEIYGPKIKGKVL